MSPLKSDRRRRRQAIISLPPASCQRGRAFRHRIAAMSKCGYPPPTPLRDARLRVLLADGHRWEKVCFLAKVRGGWKQSICAIKTVRLRRVARARAIKLFSVSVGRAANKRRPINCPPPPFSRTHPFINFASISRGQSLQLAARSAADRRGSPESGKSGAKVSRKASAAAAD